MLVSSFDSRAVCTKLVKNLAFSVSARIRVSCCSGALVLSPDRPVAPIAPMRELTRCVCRPLSYICCGVSLAGVVAQCELSEYVKLGASF